MKNLKLKDKHGWDSVGIQSKNVIEVDPGHSHVCWVALRSRPAQVWDRPTLINWVLEL